MREDAGRFATWIGPAAQIHVPSLPDEFKVDAAENFIVELADVLVVPIFTGGVHEGDDIWEAVVVVDYEGEVGHRFVATVRHMQVIA